jgi:hypothetical protein
MAIGAPSTRRSRATYTISAAGEMRSLRPTRAPAGTVVNSSSRLDQVPEA